MVASPCLAEANWHPLTWGFRQYNKAIARAQDARLKAGAFTSLSSIYSRGPALRLCLSGCSLISVEQRGRQEQALAATEEAKRLPDNFEQARQFTRALLAQ
jgi:hypothetical protein